MKERDAADLIKAINNMNVKIWLDGGWGVDALIGRQMRTHNDIDIFIEKKNGVAVIEHLIKRGYSEAKADFTSQDHTVWRDADGRIVDLHLFEFVKANKILFEGVEYDSDVLDGQGIIGDMSVQCFTAEAQVLFHQGYEHDENDTQDVLLLCKKFKIPVPKQYKK